MQSIFSRDPDQEPVQIITVSMKKQIKQTYINIFGSRYEWRTPEDTQMLTHAGAP